MRDSIPSGARLFFCCRDNIYSPFCAAVVCRGKNVETKDCLF